MDSIALIFVAFLVIALFLYQEHLHVNGFVPRSLSVGCGGDRCDIVPRHMTREHIYNGARSWYVYGPNSPPIVAYLREQIQIANNEATRSYSKQLGRGS